MTGSDVRLQRSGTMRTATWGTLGVVALLIVGVFLGAFLGAPKSYAAALGWGLLLTPLLAAVTAVVGTLKLRVGQALTVEGSDLVIARARGDRRVPTASLSEGWLSPMDSRVHLRTRSGDVYSTTVTSAAEGHELLERAGLDASKRTLRTRLGPVDFLNAMSWLTGPLIAIPLAERIGSALGMGGAVSIPLALAFFALHFYVVRGVFGPAHLVIGADGIIVKRFRDRFIPFERIRSMSAGRDHVTLHLEDGSSVRARARNLDAAAQAMIQERVDAALAVRGARSAEPSALADLDRGSRTISEWRSAMSALLGQERGYRAARLTREQIVGVLENPAAPAARRVGAAMALAGSGDGEAAKRIRVAASASANQKVRVALEKIAGGELQDTAIDELAEEEAEQALSRGS